MAAVKGLFTEAVLKSARLHHWLALARAMSTFDLARGRERERLHSVVKGQKRRKRVGKVGRPNKQTKGYFIQVSS